VGAHRMSEMSGSRSPSTNFFRLMSWIHDGSDASRMPAARGAGSRLMPQVSCPQAGRAGCTALAGQQGRPSSAAPPLPTGQGLPRHLLGGGLDVGPKAFHQLTDPVLILLGAE
jgi:hypothetical protein